MGCVAGCGLDRFGDGTYGKGTYGTDGTYELGLMGPIGPIPIRPIGLICPIPIRPLRPLGPITHSTINHPNHPVPAPSPPTGLASTQASRRGPIRTCPLGMRTPDRSC